MKRIGLVMVGTLCASAAFGDLAEYVDPFTGTAGTGHTHPAACVPFGMVQAGPDTGCNDWAYCSGYYTVRQPDDGLEIEIAAAKRAAIYRVTGGRDGEVKMLLNLPFELVDARICIMAQKVGEVDPIGLNIPAKIVVEG